MDDEPSVPVDHMELSRLEHDVAAVAVVRKPHAAVETSDGGAFEARQGPEVVPLELNARQTEACWLSRADEWRVTPQARDAREKSANDKVGGSCHVGLL